MSTLVAQTVTATERFGFTLFFAVALHAIAIIGITFSFKSASPPQKTLEITLAQYQQEKTPEQADFIAQANQTGSGESEQKKLPATPQQAALQSEKLKPVEQPQPTTAPVESAPQATEAPAKELGEHPKAKPQVVKKQQVATSKKVVKKIATAPVQKKPEPAQKKAPVGGGSLLQRSLEIASLQAEIDSHREMMAKKPRIRRLTSASTTYREDALYLDSWRKKIENIGNLNYPEEARRQKTYGSLRLLVAIEPDGSVKTIEVLESSGHRILDDAAIRIVRLAAPFQPFSVEMRKNTDMLEIIRTWKFEKRATIY